MPPSDNNQNDSSHPLIVHETPKIPDVVIREKSQRIKWRLKKSDHFQCNKVSK